MKGKEEKVTEEKENWRVGEKEKGRLEDVWMSEAASSND